MSASAADSQSWSRQRWWMVIGLVLAWQVALIFWLAGRGSPPPPGRNTVPLRVYFPTGAKSELLGDRDPTTSVRANRHGFSGSAWMQTPALPYEPPKWTDPSPPSNDVRVQQFGGVLNQFLHSNIASRVEVAAKPDPEIPIVAPDDPLANAQSTLTVEGGLANRPLRHALALKEWLATETTEILSNSVVQTGVDQNGNVFSAILASGSGSKDADASALALARAARFEPLHGRRARETDAQTWGQMVFHWHTLPAPVTNNPSLKP